jgi:DNA-directed RNA polymerase subunit M/transcription elongation factor TFIIS
MGEVAPGESVEVLIDDESDIECPMCQEMLFNALIDGWKGWRCKKCRGILTFQESFWEIVKEQRKKTKAYPEVPEPLNRDELSRRIACPSCGEMMETHPYYGPGQFVIETCRFCTLIWIDYGEIDKAIDAPRNNPIWW